jgi:inhibitor of cysteine peptidase
MKNTLFLLIVFVLIAAACSAAKPNPLSLTAADAGKTFELKTSDTFQVSLEGNPTTGYNWYSAQQDPALVEQSGEPEYKADSDRLGSAGMVTLKFKAVATGQTVLHLDYKRIFEPDVSPLQTFEVTLVVK